MTARGAQLGRARTARRLGSTRAAWALVVAGCGSSHVPSIEQACADFAEVARKNVAMCYRVAPAADESTLVSREVRSCVLTSSAPGSQLGESYWESCAAAANRDCAYYKCDPPEGVRSTGEPCLVGTQCASLWCKGTSVAGSDGSALADAVQCGVCASRLPVGAPCQVATDLCDVGSSCFGGVCRTVGTQGAPCATWSDCALPEIVCKSSGVCGTVTPTGAPCETSDDCLTDTECDIATKVCMPAQYAQPGEACDGAVHRCEAGVCDTAAGVCPTVLADGSACDARDPSKVCDDYARCFQGVCQIPDPGACR